MQYDAGPYPQMGLKEIKNPDGPGCIHSFSSPEGIPSAIFRNDRWHCPERLPESPGEVPSPSVSLMAVGGYGRSEFAPYSDVDLLLLHSLLRKPELPPLIEKTLYPLWDLGLDVSCSSRSIPNV